MLEGNGQPTGNAQQNAQLYTQALHNIGNTQPDPQLYAQALQINDLQTTIKNLTQQISTLTQERDTARTQNVAHQTTINNLTQQINTFTQERDAARAQNVAHQATIQAHEKTMRDNAFDDLVKKLKKRWELLDSQQKLEKDRAGMISNRKQISYAMETASDLQKDAGSRLAALQFVLPEINLEIDKKDCWGKSFKDRKGTCSTLVYRFKAQLELTLVYATLKDTTVAPQGNALHFFANSIKASLIALVTELLLKTPPGITRHHGHLEAFKKTFSHLLFTHGLNPLDPNLNSQQTKAQAIQDAMHRLSPIEILKCFDFIRRLCTQADNRSLKSRFMQAKKDIWSCLPFFQPVDLDSPRWGSGRHPTANTFYKLGSEYNMAHLIEALNNPQPGVPLSQQEIDTITQLLGHMTQGLQLLNAQHTDNNPWLEPKELRNF